jgi:hypothetical protein
MQHSGNFAYRPSSDATITFSAYSFVSVSEKKRAESPERRNLAPSRRRHPDPIIRAGRYTRSRLAQSSRSHFAFLFQRLQTKDCFSRVRAGNFKFTNWLNLLTSGCDRQSNRSRTGLLELGPHWYMRRYLQPDKSVPLPRSPHWSASLTFLCWRSIAGSCLHIHEPPSECWKD